MSSLPRRLLQIIFAALGGIAATAALVRLATLDGRRRPVWTLFLTLLATLAGIILTVSLVWYAAGPGDRERRPAMRVLIFSAVFGVTLTLLLARLLIGPAVEALPDAQVFLRAYVAVLAASLAVTAGFALIGALSAGALPLTRLGVPFRARPYRVGVALAVAGGVLMVPALLILVGTAVYQQGALGGNLHLSVLLGLVAALYGLLSGGLLGLLTVRVGQVWRPALAGGLGAALGGVVCGLLFPLLGVSSVIRSGWGFVVIVVLLIAVIHLGWGLGVRRAMTRILEMGERTGQPLQAASRVQVNVVATVSLVALAAALGLTRTLGEFVTSRPVNPAPLRVTQPANRSAMSACAEPTATLERAVWQVTTQDNRPDLSCQNEVYPLIRMPGPSPLGMQAADPTAIQPETALEARDPAAASGFDDVAALVLSARREVLFTTMQWEEGELNPGQTLAGALAGLYARVRADPAAYPDGIDVRLTLGNFPVVSTFEWGAEVWGALRDLTEAGVPLDDPAAKWRVRLGNYVGTFPHSHVKLLVIDGELLMGAGFNYGFGHFPRNHPSGKGDNLFDLALVTRGPVAQEGVTVFEDLWTRSKVVECAAAPDPADPQKGCRLGARGVRGGPPEVRDAQPAGAQRVFSLYRREGFTEADQAVVAVLGAAKSQVDLLQVNFSMDVSCIVALLNPALCTERDRLPYMTALLDALERGVKVRLMTDEGGLGGIENRIALAHLGREMSRRGIPTSRFQARWFPTPLHAKAMLVDNAMLVVGSMNMHYSSWTQGPLGLAEYDLATTAPSVISEFAGIYSDSWPQSEKVVLPPFLTETGVGER
ncbi:phospholipase D-like domain-containing protein [Deinococcus marmoris]|uniref:phospholipase D-like domain-containing protein n=1 Tax=Deinococcus marmoris TaxID=249408 RepID=UPI00068D6D05|nr:phospholipase D-like domain-containing protein [Deinococcus marmoris]